MAARGLIERTSRPDGLIGNYDSGGMPEPPAATPALPTMNADRVFSEDRVKSLLQTWLEANGWTVKVAWAKS